MPQGTEVARKGHEMWVEEPRHLLGHTYIITNKNVLHIGFLRYKMFWASRGCVRFFTAGNLLITFGMNSSFYVGISLLTNK